MKAKRVGTASAETTGVDRRSLLAGASVAGLAIVAGGGWFFLRPSAAKSNSIAVMPFENLSGDPSQSYFSDGIAEELRTDLSQIPGLKVVARTSSEAVRNADAVTAASKLHVSDILTGSVRRSPQMLRISAQLVDGKDGTQRWSEVYDRPIGDSLSIQSEIAQKVADALRLRIGPVDKDFRARGGTENARAQDLYLRAAAIARNDDSEAGIRASLGLIEAALAEDPSYGDAMTRKAQLLSQISTTYAANATDAQSLMQQAQEAAQRAIELAPLSSHAHVALGTIHYWKFEFPTALAEFQKIQSLGNQAGTDLAAIGWMMGLLRRFDAALRLTDEAVALDPLNAEVYRSRANVLEDAGRLQDAIQSVQHAIQLNPKLWDTHMHYALLMLHEGKPAEAQREIAKVQHQSMTVPAIGAIIAYRLGDLNEANRLLQQILNSDMLGAVHYQVAEVYAQLHRPDDAVAELDKAFAARDPGLAQMQTDFLLDPIRNDPRFQAIVRRMNFPV